MSLSFWVFATLSCLILQGFFSMQEMAIVSLNKVRLQYYVSKKNKRAIWINNLLKNPSRLFGTTLLGVNITLQIGSECSREIYQALNLDPSFAPFTQVILVLILAELAPMFAARRYAEYASMWGIPLLYAASKLLTPFIFFISYLSLFINKVFKKSQDVASSFIERDELQNIVSLQNSFNVSSQTQSEFDTIVTNIFTLKEKRAEDFMYSIHHLRMVPSQITVKQVRKILRERYYPFLPIFHKSRNNVISIAFPRDLIKSAENKRARDYAKPPWFVDYNTSILQILKQFRFNNQSVALVLDEKGSLIGALTLKQVLKEIFGKTPYILRKTSTQKQLVIEKTFPSNMKIKDFNKQFNSHLPDKGVETLSQLIVQELGHIPEKGEFIRVDQFEIRVEETSLTGAKAISIRTLL
jgi:putative hemolysin